MTPEARLRVGVAAVAAALIAVGPAALAAPELAASMFGVAAEDAGARAYFRATATRDVAMGVWLLALLAIRADRRVLGASLLALTLVPVGDAANVLATSGGRSAAAVAVHVASIGVLFGLGLLLWRRPAG